MSDINYRTSSFELGHNQLKMLMDRFWGQGTYETSLDTFTGKLYPDPLQFDVLRTEVDELVPQLCLEGLVGVRRAAAAIGIRDRKKQPEIVLPADAPAEIVHRYGGETYDALADLGADEDYGEDVRKAALEVSASFERVAEGGLLWGRHPSVHVVLEALAKPEQVTVMTQYGSVPDTATITKTYRESAAIHLRQRLENNGRSTEDLLPPRQLAGYRQVVEWQSAQVPAELNPAPQLDPATMYDDLLNDPIFSTPIIKN